MTTINAQYQDKRGNWITRVDLSDSIYLFLYSELQPTEEQIDAALAGVANLTNYATKSKAIAFAIAL